MNIFIHPTAEVSPGAEIGDGTRIWNQAQVREDSRIGTDCIISKNVYIDIGVRIGSRVKIQNNVNVYHGVTVEDDVFLGPSMTFTNDLFPRAFNADWEVSETLVKRGASIGAGAVVTGDVPDHALMLGVPARQKGWVCECGNILCFEGDHATCESCARSYGKTDRGIREEG